MGKSAGEDDHTSRDADTTELSAHPHATIMRLSPVAIAITAVDNDLIVEVNAAFERLFTVTREEVLGRSLLAMFGDSSALGRLLTLVQADGSVRDLEGGAQTKAGEPIMLSLCAEITQLGQTRSLVTFLHDITPRHMLEAALRESEDKFAKLFRAARYSMSIVDLERDCYVDVNEGFERLFGCRRDQVVGRRVGELALWAYPEERQRYVDAIRKDGVVRAMSIHGRRTDGKILSGEASGLVVEIAGRRCLITFAVDLTEQHRAEQARRDVETQLREALKLEALGALSAEVHGRP